jgi:hypothetical protein
MSQNALRYARARDFHQADTVLEVPERRMQPRQSSCCMAHIRSHPPDGGAYQPATIWNISTGGISFFLDYPLELGEHLDVQFRHCPSVIVLSRSSMPPSAKGAGWLVVSSINR